MSSSIEENFQPPEWATREEVISAAGHYINYWKIEARQRNGQWLQALAENARLKAEVERLRASSFVTAVPCEEYEKLKAENTRLKDEVEKLENEVASIGSEYMAATRHYNLLNNNLKAENKRLRKAGDAMYAYITDVIVDGRISSHHLNKMQDDWDNAAKDGKPSA
jgi:predicted RNase H-like nuclease (RuvC/YqgF family)